MTDNISGIVLDIPPTVLQNIKDADEAIRNLEQNSRNAATNIAVDFGDTMVGGVETFIRKVQEAQNILGNLKVPTIDATGLSAAIQELSQAMATIDKSATTGSNRLIRIANAITSLQIANPNPQLFQNIADGITKIGNTSQQTIQNVTQLAQVMAQLAKDIRTVQQAQNAQNANTATAAQYNKLYKEQAELIRQKNELGRKGVSATAEEKNLLDGIKGRIAEINKQIDKLNQKKQTASSDLANLRGEQRVSQAKSITTPKGAINYAKNAKSLNELQAAYKNLKAVMDTIDPNSARWKQMNGVLNDTRKRIDEIKKSMGEFKNHASGVGDIAGQLSRRLAGVFSVAAITGYINKMIEVRAQFELQQTALRALLQDKQKADQVFQQVQQMALQSPFSIMQMTTFTKQLAAYRIEADKLVGTTKMLADVSAALGVDMGRLILAYGQVKAANYLRACLGKGTKVKMFDGTFKNVEDIVVGDVLMGDDERPRNVSKLYQGEQQMYRVSYLGGAFRCNEHHILTVYDALKMRVSDVFVLDYLKEPYRYHGVKRVDGAYKTFIMKVEKDTVDTYYGFSIDGNRRFIIEDNIVTHNTEVRQFTEAGLNIAGELATYFSELQGKMISVGDVMEMITKRMVRFEDVEEVFKRVTSAGGLFYDMQKKQSDTLWGQLQRIKDAISIMFNEIGKDNQGAISNILNLVRSLINHWRMLAPIISTVGAAMATVLAVKGIQAFITSLRTMGTAVATLALKWRGVASEAAAAAVAERGATMATGIGVAVTVVTALTGALLGAWQEAHKLNEEFDRISEESSKDMWDLIYKYKDLAESVKDTSKTYSEHQKALEDLQNTFKGILPDYMLEEDYLRKITDGYTEATEALQVYSAEKARQEAQEAINTEKNKMWEDFMNTAKDSYVVFQEAIPDLKNASKAAVRGIIGNIVLQIREEYEKGMIKTAEDGYNRFMEITQEKFSSFNSSKAKHEFEVVFMSNSFGTNFQDVLDFASEKNEEFTRQYEENVGVKDEADRKHYQHWVEEHEQMSKQLDDLYAKMQAVADLKGKGLYYGESSNPDETRGVTDRGAAATDELAKQFSLVNKLRENLGLIPMDWRNITEATNTSTSVLSTFSNIQEEVVGGFKRFVAEHTKSNAVLGWINNLTGGYTTLSAQQQDMIAKSAQIIKMHGLEASVIDKLHITAETNYAAAAAAAKALSDEADANIQKIMATANELINLGRASNIAISMSSAIAKAESMWGMFISKLKGEKEAGLDIAKLFGYTDKVSTAAQKVPKTPRTRGQGQDTELNRWKNIKKAIEDTNKSYEEFRKNYSAKESNKLIEDQYGEIFKELGVDIKTFYKDSKYDAAQLAEALKVLKNMTNQNTEARKNFTNELSRDIKEVEVDIKMKLREDEIKKFKQGLDDIFNNYELSKTFADLGVNIDVVYALGGKPTTLEDVRKQIADLKAQIGGKEGAEEQYKAIEDAEKRLAKMEQKYAEERAKNYIKYLTDSLAERAQIEVRALQDINKIQQDATLDQFSKEQALNNRRKKMNEDLAKFDFDEFKSSDVYVSVFKDLEQASRSQLQYVIDKLRKLQDTYKDLSPTQVKAIANALKDAEDAMASQTAVKDFGKNLKDAIKYAKDREKIQQRQVNLQKTISVLTAVETSQSKVLYDEQLKLNGIQDKNSEEYKEQRDKVRDVQSSLFITQNLLRQYRDTLKESTDELNRGQSAWADVKGAIKSIRDSLGQAKDALDSVFTGLDSMGLVSDSMRDTFESLNEIISGLQTTMDGLDSIDITKPFSIITGSVKSLGGVLQTIGGFFGLGDKKKERQIQRLQEKVERLQKAYERLGEEIQRAFEYDEYKAGYEQSLKNIQAQQRAINEQIALEKAKKKTDEKRVKEWEDALEKLKEDERALRNQFYEDWGSYGSESLRSAGEDFVSVWLDAFKETGDGLDALNGKWDEFFENLVLKQAASAVVNKRLKGYIDRINAVLDASGLSEKDTAAMMKDIINDAKSEAGLINEQLKEWFSALGIGGGQGELLLSDLQKGIQNITEPQAAAIEAYLNSMRFAVFEQNNILTNMLTAIQAQYGANDNNTMLNEVKAIRTLVSSIDDRLSRVIISRNSSNSGYMIKVG